MKREKLVCSGCGLDPWTSKAHDGFGRCHGGVFAAGRVAGLREAAEIADEIIGYVCPEVVDAIRARADEGER